MPRRAGRDPLRAPQSDKGKALSKAERGELAAAQIADESQEVVAKVMKNGLFVLSLTTIFATARL